jgi:hypothetical protein
MHIILDVLFVYFVVNLLFNFKTYHHNTSINMLRKYVGKLCYEVIFNYTPVHIWTDRLVDGMLLFIP